MMNRQDNLDYLRTSPDITVLIIGGGINGAGTFRDLAFQGVDVLLVERADFCSGTSSASSHMVHGGIRYLENGEFRLVREAVKERNRLIENAPHYVKPLATTIPIFSWGSGLFNAPLKFLNLLDRPAERGALVIKAGLTMYDAYTGGQDTVPKHEFHLRAESLVRFPALNPEIVCTATYYDAAMPSPERINVEVVRDAELSGPHARAVNYVSAVGLEGHQIILRDELSGETFRVQPQLVVNAAGPWIDFVNKALGRETKMIGGTKGSHLVLDHPELRAAINDNEIFFEYKDGRIVLLYPFEERVLLGTSDIPIDDPDDARCTEEEVDYFLDMVRYVFPNIEVDRSHIVFRFSGVRPLPYMDAKTAGQISRDHSIEVVNPTDDVPFAIFNLVGGKWTTFRAFAEQVTDKALWWLGLTRAVSTEDVPLGGAEGYPRDDEARTQLIAEWHAGTGIAEEWLSRWLDRYGTRGREIARLALERGGDAPLEAHAGYSRCEMAHLINSEMAIRLDDLLLRRTLIGMFGEATPALVEELAEIASAELGWSTEQKAAEIAHVKRLFAERHQVAL